MAVEEARARTSRSIASATATTHAAQLGTLGEAAGGEAFLTSLADSHSHTSPASMAEDSVREGFQMIFEHPGVSSIIIGTINPSHLSDNAAKAKELSARKL